MKLHARLFPAFVGFARQHVASGDIDPTYPVLRNVYKAERCDIDHALWRTFLYVVWYNLRSAEAMWKIAPAPASLPVPELLASGLPATGTERRGFRGLAGYRLARAHVDAVLMRTGGDLRGWVESAAGPGGEEGWRRIRKEWQTLPHGGPWSSYKWADLLAHVHGYPITADDIGVGGGSPTAGPIPGMVALTGESWKRCAADVPFQRELLARCHDQGVSFSGLDQMETSLCDFNSMLKGGYYVGHDIDQQQQVFQTSSAVWWEARAASFRPKYLGESNGWIGVRPKLNDHFKKTGKVWFP